MSANESDGQDSTEILVAGDDAEIVDGEDRDDGRPDDCDCLPTFEDLPCFACYQAGFTTPTPSVDDEA